VSVADLRDSLFADLPAERLVNAPGEPLSATELALRSNLALVQRLMFHAAILRVTVEGNTRLHIRALHWRSPDRSRCFGTSDYIVARSGS